MTRLVLWSGLLALASLAGCSAPTLRDQAPTEFREHLPGWDTEYEAVELIKTPERWVLVPASRVDRYDPGNDAGRVAFNVVGTARRRAEGRYEVALAFKPTWPRGQQWPRMTFLGVALFAVPADAGPTREEAIAAALAGSSPRLELNPKPRELGKDYATAVFELAEEDVPWPTTGSARFLVSHAALDKQGTFARSLTLVQVSR